MLTISAICLFIVLFVLSMVTASIAHHSKSFEPIWLVFYKLNKLSVPLIPVAIVIDLIRVFS